MHVINDSLFSLELDIISDFAIGKRGKRKFYTMDQQGELIDSVFSYERHINSPPTMLRLHEKPVQLPFPNPSDSFVKVVFDEERNIYTSTGEDFIIHKYDAHGTHLKSFYYPYSHSRFDKEPIIEKNSFSPNRRRMAREFEYPEVWPAIDEFFVDDEKRIWVSTIIDDEEYYEWWVLKNSGELLAKFKWPGKRLDRDNMFRSRPLVKNGYFYFREEDGSTGVKKVVKYKIELEKVRG